jgi:hypothetical protein
MKIRSFRELHTWLKAFAEGDITLLVVQARGGLGKTYQVNRAFEGVRANVFSGHATPLSIYKDLYFNKDAPTVFDDVDALLLNKTTVALLKQICDTNEKKTVRYTSTAPAAADVPSSYETTTRTIIITNDLKSSGKNLGALLTRGVVLTFEPSAEEVFKALSAFAEDKEILKHLEGMFERIDEFNFRHYEIAVQVKAAGLDWRDWLERSTGAQNYRVIIEDCEDMPPAERFEYWKQKTGLSKRSYYRYAKEYKTI